MILASTLSLKKGSPTLLIQRTIQWYHRQPSTDTYWFKIGILSSKICMTSVWRHLLAFGHRLVQSVSPSDSWASWLLAATSGRGYGQLIAASCFHFVIQQSRPTYW